MIPCTEPCPPTTVCSGCATCLKWTAYASSPRDVRCRRCGETYHREFDDAMQGVRCAGYVNVQDDDGGYDGELDSSPSLKSVPPGALYIYCGYGSGFDGSRFRFGRFGYVTMDRAPLWIRDAEKPILVCDPCIREMIKTGEIRVSCSSDPWDIIYPAICDGCDRVFSDEDCDFVVEVEQDCRLVDDRLTPVGWTFQVGDGRRPLYFHGNLVPGYVKYQWVSPEKPRWLCSNYRLCNDCGDDLVRRGLLKQIPLQPGESEHPGPSPAEQDEGLIDVQWTAEREEGLFEVQWTGPL